MISSTKKSFLLNKSNFINKKNIKIVKKKINKNKKRSNKIISIVEKIHKLKEVKKDFLVKASVDIGIVLECPLEKGTYWKSSPYGIRFNKKKNKYELHGGVDFAAAKGTPVYAASDGKVIEVSIKKNGFGKSVVIKHDKKIKTRYAHLSKIIVSYQQEVKLGDVIGLVGSTGNTRGKKDSSHLHFEVIIDGKKHNPLLYIKK